MPSEFADLSPCQHFQPSVGLETLRRIQLNFPINELTPSQWNLLETLVDPSKPVPIHQIVTYRFSDRIEFCPENGVHLQVTRYIEADPFRREIHPKRLSK